MEKMNLKEAVQYWVRGFNAIPQQLIIKSYPNMEDGLEVLATELECSNCGCTEYTENEDGEKVCDNCEEVDEFYNKYDLPMWGTMWTFEESSDANWARNNLGTLRECGFWVYESDELGVIIGINGAGYDFYEDHWIPLYKARGLRWHTEG